MGIITSFDLPNPIGQDDQSQNNNSHMVSEVYSPPQPETLVAQAPTGQNGGGTVVNGDGTAGQQPGAVQDGGQPQAAVQGDGQQPAPDAGQPAPVADRPMAPAAQAPAAAPVEEDKSARYVPPDLAAAVDALLNGETNNTKKEILEKLKAEKSNAERIKLLETLINGKLDNETRREILAPEASPEKKRSLEQMLLKEREIERRYKVVRETVMKTLPDFKDFFLNGERDQQRQSIYLALIREDGNASLKDLKELLGLENDQGKQGKINGLINDKGDLDRVAVVRELLNGETDPRKKQLLEQILKHETNIKAFGTMLDEKPNAENIKAVQDIFKDANEAKRLEALTKTTNDTRNALINQLSNQARRPEVKQELDKLSKETKPEERVKIIQALITGATDGATQSQLKQLLELERKLGILSDLPKEETRRQEAFEALDKASRGDYESVMKAYPLCAEWLKQAVPEAFVEIGYQMGMPIPPGCPMKLPIEHGRPVPPRLMELYAKEGRIKFDMELNADKLLNPAENVGNVANLINSVEWLYTTKGVIREKSLRFEADALVDVLRKSFGPEGVRKYGPDGIPKGWMPPENVEDIPAWRDRVIQVVNLGNRLRNYAQAMKSIDGIQSSEQGLADLKALGVEFEFGKGNTLTKFIVPQLDGLDLRMQIPANHGQIKGLEQWLAKYHKDVDKALDPYREAMDKLITQKDPKAFLRHGDFPFNEGLHPKIGVPYDLVSQRVTNVKREGGKVIIEGTISYQTSSWYSYNYWLGCEPVARSMSPQEFRQVNGLADGAEPREGEKYKIKGADGETYEGWTYKGKNSDGTLNFMRDETFKIEVSEEEYIPAMTAMGGVQLLKGKDQVDQWLYGFKINSFNPGKWELPQVGFWHHGLKWGKAVMDVGLTLYGGAGLFARGATWGARAMAAGRMAVGTVGLTHHIMDHAVNRGDMSKETRDGIHMASHAFILADIGLGLGLQTFKQAFGIGAAAKESASLLSTLGHGALAVDGIAIFGPVVAADINGVIENHMGWTTQQALDRALDQRGTPERLINQEGREAAPKFDLTNKAVRDSMEVMVDRLGKTLLTETTDAATKQRIEQLIQKGKEAMALDRNDPKRKAFLVELSKMFTPADSAVLWSHIQANPSNFQTQFKTDAQARLGTDTNTASPQEKLIAASLALVLEANERGEMPESLLKRTITIPAHKERVNGEWKDVPESTKEVSFSRDELVGFVTRLAESSDKDSLRVGASKMLWRMGKLDNNGLAGVLLEVVKKSNNKELVGLSLIDTKDVSLGFLINDITHNEILTSKNGYVAMQQYRAKYYGLTSDDLKRDLKAVMGDTTRSADVRALALEVLSANDHDKVVDRKRALEECDRRWQKESGTDGKYATELIQTLKFQAQQDIPAGETSRKIKVLENGVEKEVTVTLQPDDIRNEKFKALMALKTIGTIKVDGADYQLSPETLNANLLKCMTKTNIDLTIGVVKNIDAAKLTAAERRELLAILGWPTNGDSQRLKVEVLKKIRDIVGGDRDIAREVKERLLDMVNPGSRPRDGSDYSFVGAYPDLHAATITALASFGAQHLSTAAKTEPLTKTEFEGRLVEGQTKDLIVGKYYQLKEGDNVAWYRYMGKTADNKERFVKQGDPTVATIIQHLRDADRIGSAKVRLAVAQAAGDLQIPGLRELMADAIKKETDPRVARRLREIKFPEEPPLDPKSDVSIERLQAYITQLLADQQFKTLDEYGAWLKTSQPILFDKGFRDAWQAAWDNTYGGIGGFFSFAGDDIGSVFGGKSPSEYMKEQHDKVDKSYTDALEKLVNDAKTSTDAATRTNSIQALMWIIVNRGADMPVRWRNYTIDSACLAFVDLTKQGCKDRGAAVKWCIEKLLIQQPDLSPDRKQALLAAAINLAVADKDQNQNDQAMTKEHLAKVLHQAITASAGWPDKNTNRAGYDKEVAYRKDMINLIATFCRDGSSAELLEAIAETFKDKCPELAKEAEDCVRWLRDGVIRNVADARKNPDRTSTAELRKNAIVDNLSDPSKSTEDVVRAIARAVEGYEWGKNRDSDELLRTALRQAKDDQRTRVRMIASRYLLTYGDGDDLIDAAETLHTIANSPYKYADSPRDLKFFKLEAQDILTAFEKAHERAEPRIKQQVTELLGLGRQMYQEKKDGSVMAYRMARPDRSKSLTTAQQELETLLNNDNANEIDLVKAIFAAQSKHDDRTLGPTEPIFDLYKKALEHRSEKVRMAAAWSLMRSTSNEGDLNRSVEVMRNIEKTSGNAQLKKEAGQWLNWVAGLNRFSVGGIGSAREATLPSADRAKSIENLTNLLKDPKEENIAKAVKEIFALRSADGKLKADDPALAVLRDAANNRLLIIQTAASMVLAEQSPEAADVRRAIVTLDSMAKSNRAPRIRQDAENFLKKLKETDATKAGIITEIQTASDRQMNLLVDVVRTVQPTASKDLNDNSAKLQTALTAAKDNPRKSTSDDAVKAIFHYGLGEGGLAKDSPVTAKIRETAASHPDERVRLAAAWILAQVAPAQDDESTGYMVLARLAETATDNNVKVEANSVLSAQKQTYEQVLASTTATDGQKTRARWALAEIERHRTAAKPAEANR